MIEVKLLQRHFHCCHIAVSERSISTENDLLSCTDIFSLWRLYHRFFLSGHYPELVSIQVQWMFIKNTTWTSVTNKSLVVTKLVTVCAQSSECQREEIQKARVNDGSNYDSLKPLTDPHHMVIKYFLLLGLAAECKSRRWCAINIAADHHMFTTLTGEVSWQRLRRSAVDFNSNEKFAIWATLLDT